MRSFRHVLGCHSCRGHCFLLADVFSPAVTTGHYLRFSLGTTCKVLEYRAVQVEKSTSFFPNPVGTLWYPVCQPCSWPRHVMNLLCEWTCINRRSGRRKQRVRYCPLFWSHCFKAMFVYSTQQRQVTLGRLPGCCSCHAQLLRNSRVQVTLAWPIGRSTGTMTRCWHFYSVYVAMSIMLHVNHFAIEYQLALLESAPKSRRTIPCWAVYSPCWHWTGKRVSRPVEAAATRRKEHRSTST